MNFCGEYEIKTGDNNESEIPTFSKIGQKSCVGKWGISAERLLKKDGRGLVTCESDARTRYGSRTVNGKESLLSQ